MSIIRRRQGRTLALAFACVATLGGGMFGWLKASDHRDSALLTSDRAADIADVYAFRSPSNPDNLVLSLTLAGFIPPGPVNSDLFFDPNVLYQIKIDTNNDAVEDLVIQARVTGKPGHQVMHFRGPARPQLTGVVNRWLGDDDADADDEGVSVRVSDKARPIIEREHGMTVFAGIRDDPFFFDLGQFRKIVAGQASSFNNPGFDTFKGFNALAMVIELPISRLGNNPNINVWGTTSRPRS